MTEEQIVEVGLLGWFISKTPDGRNTIETPNGEFIIEEDFDAFGFMNALVRMNTHPWMLSLNLKMLLTR